MIRFILTICLCFPLMCFSQDTLMGRVLDSISGVPLPDATVQLKEQIVKTDAKGRFVITFSVPATTLSVSLLGYKTKNKLVDNADDPLVLLLAPLNNAIEEVVVNTGFTRLSKERSAGSFTQIDNTLLNRSQSGNLLDRLEGITNGLQFDRSNIVGEDVQTAPSLRVRGISTLHSDARPLIVIDNFPYEGDINLINPNDVESVTILKDATAASIWGVRAGNGVIVITTKKGNYNQPASISFRSYANMIEKPDLWYSQNRLLPNTVMEIQKELWERGVYPETNTSRIPVYVEWLINEREGHIDTDELRRYEDRISRQDIRNDASRYQYQMGLLQMYTLGIRGGGPNHRYFLSAGADREAAQIQENRNQRKTISLQQTFKVWNRLELESTIRYNSSEARENGVPFSSIGLQNAYLTLRDNNQNLPIMHNAQAIRYGYQQRAEEQGLKDWMYRPLDEVGKDDLKSVSNDLGIGFNAVYDLGSVKFMALYQFNKATRGSTSLYEEDGYYVRNLINKFTQQGGRQIIPDGAILVHGTPSESNSHYGRGQVSYDRSIFNNGLQISALLGGELSQVIGQTGVPFTWFGYDKSIERGTPQTSFARATSHPVRPEGNEQVPIAYSSPNKTQNRTLSYYGNVGLMHRNKYGLNTSLRWDGSNLLGVKTNARGTALWSLGGLYNLHHEDFFNPAIFSRLAFRATYGLSGNINKSQGHYPVISKNFDSLYELDYAILNSPGNPNLRWEQVETLNLGFDWSLKNFNGLSGSVELYSKRANHLLSDLLIDPTLGVGENYMENYASMHTKGIDISLINHVRVGAVNWRNRLLINFTENRVTNVTVESPAYLSAYFTNAIYVPNVSRDMIYAYRWYGLDHDGGLPIRGEAGMDIPYQEYLEGLTFDDLRKAGVSVAPWYASFNPSVEWEGIQLSLLLSYKGGHYFRRNSMQAGAEYAITGHNFYHMDYYKRWKNPGDELYTDVPASIDKYDDQMGSFYRYAEVLVTPAASLRLQDITMDYSFPKEWLQAIRISNLNLHASVRNVGILWRKNKHGIDPDVPNAYYPRSRQYNIGLSIDF